MLILFISVLFLFGCKSNPLHHGKTEIINPEFNVISIYIIQADLVVTEFEAVIKIDNPNFFDVDLSSISYELYGNNRLWAKGSGNDLRAPGARSRARSANENFRIPANGTGEVRFFFSMNFTNMNRVLLDDIIAMRSVNYRFLGNAEIQPVLNNVPSFSAGFDCSGFSEVKKRSD